MPSYAASQISSTNLDNDSYAWTGHYAVNRPYTTNGLNQYTAAGGPAFSYDPNGDLTSDGANNNYVYDIENRLVSASGAHNATLAYDPLGRLSRLTASGATTTFLYDGDDLVAEYDGAGAMTRRYVHWVGDDTPLLSYLGGDLSQPSYLHADQQGSIILVTDQAGNPSINRYDEYGIPAATNVGRFQYTGQIRLPEIGMYYYKARIYSPTLGRFLQTDPVGYEDQYNLYDYVGDDPVNHTDSTGKSITEIGFAIFDVAQTISDIRNGAPAGEILLDVANVVLDVQPVPGLSEVAHLAEGARAAERGYEAVRAERSVTTLRPGPHAREGMPARGPTHNFRSEERREMNRQMAEHGCHTCGERDPGTTSGNAIPDHQPANALNPPGGPQRIYPHCDTCRRRQAGEVTQEVMRRRRENAR